jgi:hypothetical protein
MKAGARRLTARTIERRAAILLVEYQAKYGYIERAPVPVDDILEVYLQLHLEWDSLARFGIENAHAVLDAATRTVTVDERLDPTDHPEMNGRYRFTLAHEIGHWRLHPKAHNIHSQPSSSDTRFVGSDEEFEWQADKFAAYLLMPEYLVRREWADVYGTDAPFEVTPDMEAVGRENLGSKAEFFNALAAAKSEPLADRFGVSMPAMRIRLQELRLVPRP